MEKLNKNKILVIVAVVTLLLAVGGATFAYFIAQGGSTEQTNINVLTHTTDNLAFEVGAPINIYADQTNFSDGMPNKTGTTNATATAKAGSNTQNFVGKYNIFFVIDENDFEYTTSSNTAELIMSVKAPDGSEVTSIPNLTHTTVGDVSGFDITTKKGTFAIAKEYVIEALTSKTTIQNWEITVTLVNLDSNQNRNTSKTFNGQIFVTKEDMESYALPIVNTIETTVGASGTELEVKAKTGTSTAEVKNYYYAIEEKGTRVAMLRLANTKALTYEQSTSDTHRFTGLTAGKEYTVSIYTEDANGFKSPVYKNEVTTDDYVLPKIGSVEASVRATSFDVTVNATQGNSSITKYFYKVEGIDKDYQVSTSNKKTYENLTTGKTYTVHIYAEDANGRKSYEYTMKVTPYEIMYHETCNDNTLACTIAKKYTIQGENNLYYHNGTILDANGNVLDANDKSYRYAGSYETTHNWVCFGTDDENCDDEHLYRIIGVFDEEVIETSNNSTVQNERIIKLIKAYEGSENSLGRKSDNTTSRNASYYKGKLKTIPTYKWSWWSSGSNNWSDSGLNTSILNGTYLTTLGKTWSDKIAITKWKLGGGQSQFLTNYNSSALYQSEIAKANVFKQNKIGLMYVNDYGFAASSDNWSTMLYYYDNVTTRNNNWLYLGVQEWTISRDHNSGNRNVLDLNYTGSVYTYFANSSCVVRPTFYLNHNVTFAGGTGTASDPYRIA